jgi:hypothetical protein
LNSRKQPVHIEPLVTSIKDKAAVILRATLQKRMMINFKDNQAFMMSDLNAKI